MMSDRPPTDILLRLSLVEGFFARHLAQLPSATGLPFRGGQAVPRGRCGIVSRAAAALVSGEHGERAARIRERCDRSGIEIVPLGADDYPALLRDVPDAPLVLYRKGSAAWDRLACVALVGSRAPTGAGRRFARELGSDLAQAGCAVVSGMARGIDAASHDGAARVGGTTVAVLGCGVDVLYPPESRELRERILERGAVLSELPPGTPPLPRHFPQRNRIISGMSRAVVVVEAPQRSGALITARIALEQGKEVLAVPGNPIFPHTAGSNALLRDGAVPVTEAADVLAVLGWGAGGAPGRFA